MKIKKVIGIILIISALVLVILYGLSWIPQKVDIKAYGNIKTVGDNYSMQLIGEDTLHIEGKLYTPWFSNPIFRGKVYLENAKELYFELSDKATSYMKKTQDAFCILGAGGGLEIEADGTSVVITGGGDSQGGVPRSAEIDITKIKSGEPEIIEADFTYYPNGVHIDIPYECYTFEID